MVSLTHQSAAHISHGHAHMTTPLASHGVSVSFPALESVALVCSLACHSCRVSCPRSRTCIAAKEIRTLARLHSPGKPHRPSHPLPVPLATLWRRPPAPTSWASHASQCTCTCVAPEPTPSALLGLAPTPRLLPVCAARLRGPLATSSRAAGTPLRPTGPPAPPSAPPGSLPPRWAPCQPREGRRPAAAPRRGA